MQNIWKYKIGDQYIEFISVFGDWCQKWCKNTLGEHTLFITDKFQYFPPKISKFKTITDRLQYGNRKIFRCCKKSAKVTYGIGWLQKHRDIFIFQQKN
jgi:hypothetical protein